MSDDLRAENAELRRRLDSAMLSCDMEHARMAALVEACEAFAEFALMYSPENPPPLILAFLANLRVYGKNARAAVTAVRPQADALLALLADLSRQIGEQNTTIGYQDAMLSAAYHALQSYAHGNGAPDLAIEVAATIEKAVEKASQS